MKWIDKLERKFGHLGIPNLIAYIIGLNAFVYFLGYTDPTGFFESKLYLDPYLVLQGEVWRLITFIFIPPATSLFWIVFVLYFYYMIGTALEHEWGTFRFNLYYLLGILGTILAAFVTGSGATANYIHSSLFLAFATLYPNYEILLFFILPVKIKYLAYLNWAFIGYTVLFLPIPLKVIALVSIINYFIFFSEDILYYIKNRRRVYHNRKRFHSQLTKDFIMHRCTICGITEKDDPNMDFRYCSACEGDYEYCRDHLHTHEHIKNAKDE